MELWKIDPDRTSFDGDPRFSAALDHLRSGRLVAVPTETVYGLAADAGNSDAVAGIYEAKERPRFNPLICHIEGIAAAERYGVLNADARLLADSFWPGPLTLVVAKRADAAICDLATAGLETIALRVPAAPIMRALAERLERPLAAPSANRSGRVSPTSAEDVAAELGDRVAMIIDAGRCTIGIESTIIDVSGDQPGLLRPGGIATAELEAVLGHRLAAPQPAPGAPAAPGMLASHYAPRARVRLDAEDVAPDEALLAFGPILVGGAETAIAVENLSATGDLREAAQNLFRALRRLDDSGVASIAVMSIPDRGLGEAIRDRLVRAAAPRSRHGHSLSC